MAKEGTPTHCWAPVVFCTLTALLSAGAYAQSPDDIQDQIEVELIAPQSVIAGESFTVYARVHNLSERGLSYPTIERNDYDADSSAGFSYKNCGVNCIQVGHIAPGETVYLGAGTYYYTDELLTAGELQVKDYTLRYLDSDALEIDYLSVIPELTIAVSGPVNTGNLNPAFVVPERQLLQIRDLFESGDELIVHDPNTGHDWVRHDATRNLMQDEILAALAPGGQLEDFSLARISQVEELLMNHLHASGHQAQILDIYPNTPPRLEKTMASFVRMMQPAIESSGDASLWAAVADRVLSVGFESDLIGTLNFSVRLTDDHQCGCAQFFGLRRGGQSLAAWQSARNLTALWLVRAPEPLPSRPMATPSLFDNELVVPDLLVDGVHYHATLTLIDPIQGLYRLSGLDQTAPSGGDLEFDTASGRLSLPEVIEIDRRGETSGISMIMDLIEGTTPPIFQVMTSQALPPAES